MTKDEDAEWLFGNEGGDSGEWEAHRRFISDTYNPIYRQGVVSAYHLSETEFAEFLGAARSNTGLAAVTLLKWVNTDRPQGGDYGDVAMERLAARASSFDSGTAQGIVSVFGEVMDDYHRLRPKKSMFTDVWLASERILRTFRSSVPDFALEEAAAGMAQDGRALSWMTGNVGRSELWDHGLAGDRPKDEAERLLSPAALENYLTILVKRLSRLKSVELLSLPRLGSVLFTLHESPWHKSEAQQILRRLAGPRTTDTQFLSFLEAMAGVTVSSDRGAYFTLPVKPLHSLLGKEQFDRRWSRIVMKSLNADLDNRRSKILSMMSEAKDW